MNIKGNNYITSFFGLLALTSCKSAAKAESESKPNIVIIYVDDLGYGDLSCYGATRISTPNIDKLAENGIRFTDAHSPAAVSAPSRYSMMTGKYPFRRDDDAFKQVQGDTDPSMINPKTPTLPSTLQQAGYKTAVVGKWHLGLGDGAVDWNKKITPGPAEIGFDYSFLIPVTGDRVPLVFVENQKVVNLKPTDPLKILFIDSHDEKAGDLNPFPDPTGLSNPELLSQKSDYQHSGTIVNGVSRIGFMTGGNSARFDEKEFPFILKDKAIEFMKTNKDNPFFLYFAFNDIHVPRIPNEKFKGKSSMGPRGDAILQTDWVTGEIVKALEELGIAENTLIIFSSDNGPILYDGYDDQSLELVGDHKPAGPFRGGKYSIFEGANRVPTIACWPSKIKPQVSDALWSHTDLFASLTKLAGGKLKAGAAPDSEDVLDAILGKSKKGRTVLLEEGSTFALRKGNWKYIQPSNEDMSWIKTVRFTESGILPVPQLYNLANDIGETKNLAAQYPELVAEMDSIMKSILNKK